MDQRQTKIVEGAGLEESRLNTDFIDFLRRWGSHLLLIVAGVFAAYSALDWWQRSKDRALDTAYAELSAAQVAGSPDNLLRVAREHSSQGAVGELATLAAADAFLNAGWSGVAPGGDPNNADDLLNDEQRRANYARAKELYEEVASRIANDKELTLHLLNSRFGIAAATASLGQIDEAKALLSDLAALARSRGYDSLAEVAEAKIEALDKAAELPPLYDAAAVKVAERPVVDNADLTFDASPAPAPVGGVEGPVLPEQPADTGEQTPPAEDPEGAAGGGAADPQ